MSGIFVFGSNRAGKHYGGAARTAVEKYGAIIGQGEGMQGMSYALPTLDENFKPLTMQEVHKSVDRFLDFARGHRELEFHVTAVGCGIAGFKRADISPMFKDAPENCFFFEAEFGKKIPDA
jgi:hypothetical protein